MGDEAINWVGVGVTFLVYLIIVIGMLITPLLIGAKGFYAPEKHLPYECGMNPKPLGEGKIKVRFILPAVLFVILDVWLIYLIPWAVVFKDFIHDPILKKSLLSWMALFLLTFFIAYLFIWRTKAFLWYEDSK